MEKTINFSLRPLSPALWKTHAPTGVRFKIKPLDPEFDQQFNRESRRADSGDLDLLAFYARVIKHCVEDWEGITDAGAPAPCNAENITLLLKHNSTTFGPFICAEARSIDYFIQGEKTAAKNA